MAAIMVEKEKKVKDTERLYMNLREILSKHPGPQVALTLNKTQKVLRERGQKMKVGIEIIFHHYIYFQTCVLLVFQICDTNFFCYNHS